MSDLVMSRDEVRAVDRRAIEQYRMPGTVLMENAGRGCVELLLSLSEFQSGPVVVCAGKGNNGGDGFVIARHLENRGVRVRVLVFCDPQDYTGDARTNYEILEAAGTPIHVYSTQPDPNDLQQRLADATWIVDSLLGTGTHGAIREPFATVIRAVNAANKHVLAVDLPSGMDCDTGEALPEEGSGDADAATTCCVRADHTATFVARKRGFDGAGASDYTGPVHVIDIGVPRAALQA